MNWTIIYLHNLFWFVIICSWCENFNIPLVLKIKYIEYKTKYVSDPNFNCSQHLQFCTSHVYIIGELCENWSEMICEDRVYLI